jgi:hypothetical protein
MDKNITFDISYGKMKMIVKKYYAQQGRDVELKINNVIDTDRFEGTATTSMELVEKTTFGGIEFKAPQPFDMGDLREVVSDILEQEGKEFVDLRNNAVVESKFEGCGIAEHEVKYITGRSFTISARENILTPRR